MADAPFDLDQYMIESLRAAPELTQAPWLAAPLAQQSQQDGNSELNAQAGAHTANMAANQKAQQDLHQHRGNWFMNALHWIGGNFSSVTKSPTALAGIHGAATGGVTGAQVETAQASGSMNNATAVAGLPTQEAQHQYRALRDIRDRHGVAAALAETLGIAAGATVGAYAGGTVDQPVSGAVLGGEAVAGASERLLFPDSWARTADGNAYRDIAGHHVSIGRDIARGVFRLRDGTLPFNVASGIGDAVADLQGDPLARGLGVGRGVGEQFGVTGGQMLNGPEAVDNVLNKGTRAQAAFRDIAAKNAGEIIRDYPQFSAVAHDLGQATTVDQVGDVFRDALQGSQLRGKWLPYRPPAFEAPSGIAAGTPIADDPIGRVAQFKRVLTEKVPSWLNPETLKFSRSVIDPTAPSALPAMRAELMFGRMSSRLVDGVMSDIAAAQASGQTDLARIIFRNAMEHSALSTGIDADSQSGRILLGKIRGEITDTMGGVSGGDGMHAGYDMEGRDRSFIQNDEGGRAGAALVEGQRGMLTLPTHPDWVAAIREAKGNMALFGRLDDWGYGRLMAPFKQMALMTGGTALRIASAEAIPALFRNNLIATIKAGVSAKLGAREAAAMTPLEQENYVANAVHLLHGPDGVVNEPSLVDDATLLAVHNGEILPHALSVDEYVANDAVGKVEADRLNMFKSSQSVPAERVETGRFEGKSQGEQNFPLYWQRAIREFADDEGIQRAAAAYRDAYISAGRERVPMSRADVVDVGSREAGAPVGELGPSAPSPSETPVATGQVPAVAEPQPEPSLTSRSKAELVRIATRAAEEADHGYLANDMNPAVRNDMMRNARPATPGQDPLRSWAHERVAVMKGLTHAPTVDEMGTVVGEPHMHILDSMANGDTPELKTLADITPKDRPFMVKGRVTETTAAGNIIDRAASAMWRRVFDPIVGTLGREHQYLLSFHDQMDTFRPMVAEGQLSIEDAVQHAQVNAINDVVRFVHNPYERTQMATLVKNIAPFYFAQEQAYRRVGRLLATDPEAFRRYQMTVSAFTDAVHKVKDAQGQNHFVIPGLGWLDETAINGMATAGLPFASAVPSEVLGNTSSLATVFPFSEGVRPSFSPFVTLAAHALSPLLPEAAQPYTRAVVGPYASQPVWSQLVPNAPLRDLITATTSDRSMMSSADWAFRELGRQQNVAMSKWVAAGHSRDDPGAPQIVPPPTAAPDVRQAFIERLRNTARINQVFRAIFAAVSPLSPTIDVGKYGIKQEMHDYITKYGLQDGTQRFLEANPNATPYSISSTDVVDSSPFAETKAATDFFLHNRDLFHAYPAAAGYLVPQSTNPAYDPAVAQEQIALGLREHKSTTQIVNDFYVNAGYAQFNADSAAHRQAVAQLGFDKRAITDENANWHAYLTGQLAAANPVWWDYFTSKDRDNRYAREITQLRQAVTDRRTPQTAQTAGIRGLLADLDEHLNALADGKARHWPEEERQSEVDNWQSYLDQQQAQHPELKVVISRLFKHEGAK